MYINSIYFINKAYKFVYLIFISMKKRTYRFYDDMCGFFSARYMYSRWVTLKMFLSLHTYYNFSRKCCSSGTLLETFKTIQLKTKNNYYTKFENLILALKMFYKH